MLTIIEKDAVWSFERQRFVYGIHHLYMDASQLVSKNSLRLLRETVVKNALKGGNCSCSYLTRSMS